MRKDNQNITLYYDADCASLIINAVLRELGETFKLVRVTRSKGEHLLHGYVTANPFSLIPTLVVGERTLFETAAICEYLCVRSNSQLYRQDAEFTLAKYIVVSELHALVNIFFHTQDYGVEQEDLQQVWENLEKRIFQALSVLESRFFQEGSWLVRNGFSFLDMYLGVICRWLPTFPKGYQLKIIDWTKLPSLTKMLWLLQEKTSMKLALLDEGIEGPMFQFEGISRT